MHIYFKTIKIKNENSCIKKKKYLISLHFFVVSSEMGKTTSPPAVVPVPIPVAAPATSSAVKAPANYTDTRIQVRLQNGSALTQTFSVKEQLSVVRLFIQLNQGNDVPFSLMTNFPKKVFTDEDYDKPLEVLGLVPSAVLIVTKATT